MKRKIISILIAAAITIGITACNSTSVPQVPATETVQETTASASEETTASVTEEATADENVLRIVKQGMFSAGGTVTDPLPGEYNDKTNWQDDTRAGNTMHVDHANVFYQIPENDNGNPIVFLHGAGQSRMGWMTTPDGREGWSDIFLKKGHSVFLVDQPRRGEAGSTAEGPVDTLPGDQAWYTHFRIGRIAPERYENSQFPEGEEAQDQFFRQMTPNTGEYDQAVIASAMDEVLQKVYDLTGKKAILVTHSQGGLVGWDVSLDNVAAIVAIEPGIAPSTEMMPEAWDKFMNLSDKVPITFYYGDNIDNGPGDIDSTAFWQMSRGTCETFSDAYNEAGGDATVINLPDEGFFGNSHFLFQELNNKEIADHVEAWLDERGLG